MFGKLYRPKIRLTNPELDNILPAASLGTGEIKKKYISHRVSSVQATSTMMLNSTWNSLVSASRFLTPLTHQL